MSPTLGGNEQMALFYSNMSTESNAPVLCVLHIWWVMAASRLTDHADHADMQKQSYL